MIKKKIILCPNCKRKAKLSNKILLPQKYHVYKCKACGDIAEPIKYAEKEIKKKELIPVYDRNAKEKCEECNNPMIDNLCFNKKCKNFIGDKQ